MFSVNYVYLCAQRKIGVTAAAEEMGFSRASGKKWANGSVPRKTTLCIIADYFGVTVEWLLADHEKTAPGDGDGRVAEFERAVNLLFADHPENLSRLLDALAADPEKTKAKFDLFLATL